MMKLVKTLRIHGGKVSYFLLFIFKHYCYSFPEYFNILSQNFQIPLPFHEQDKKSFQSFYL